MMVKGVLGWQRGGNQFRAEQPEGSVTDSCEEMKPIDYFMCLNLLGGFRKPAESLG